MTEEAAQGLRESIEAWENRRYEKDSLIIIIGISTCPLCHIYYRSKCQGCPLKAPQPYCRDTPHRFVLSALTQWQMNPQDETLRTLWQESATRMIEHMKAKLP